MINQKDLCYFVFSDSLPLDKKGSSLFQVGNLNSSLPLMR